jgi:hypothetical protein
MAGQVLLTLDRPVSLETPLPGAFEMSGILLTPDCIRNGKPAKTELQVVYRDDGHGLPLLSLFRDGWSNRKADFRGRDSYDVEEINTGMDGRAFLLHRTPEAIAKSSDSTQRYGVLIARNGQDDLCECRGFEKGGYCKHVNAMRGLIEAGHIDRPGEDAPVDAFPSPEQAAHDAKRADSLPEGFDPFDGEACGQQFPDEPPEDGIGSFDLELADADLHVGASYKPGHSSDIAF